MKRDIYLYFCLYLLSYCWILHATSRFAIICKVKIKEKRKRCVLLIHFVIVFYRFGAKVMFLSGICKKTSIKYDTSLDFCILFFLHVYICWFLGWRMPVFAIYAYKKSLLI